MQMCFSAETGPRRLNRDAHDTMRQGLPRRLEGELRRVLPPVVVAELHLADHLAPATLPPATQRPGRHGCAGGVADKLDVASLVSTMPWEARWTHTQIHTRQGIRALDGQVEQRAHGLGDVECGGVWLADPPLLLARAARQRLDHLRKTRRSIACSVLFPLLKWIAEFEGLEHTHE